MSHFTALNATFNICTPTNFINFTVKFICIIVKLTLHYLSLINLVQYNELTIKMFYRCMSLSQIWNALWFIQKCWHIFLESPEEIVALFFLISKIIRSIMRLFLMQCMSLTDTQMPIYMLNIFRRNSLKIFLKDNILN